MLKYSKLLNNRIIIRIRSISSSSCSSINAKSKQINIYSCSEVSLTDTMVNLFKQPKFRVKQIMNWLYAKGISDFDDMLDIPINIRNKLKDFYSIGCLELATELVSKDGTIKRAYQLDGGQLIETVLMPYKDGRNTACLSSQAGCAMGCVFCATGQMGFSRQLTSTEIFEQAVRFSGQLQRMNPPQRLSNVVMMGMGEPMANYNNVMKAIKRMNEELGIGARHITISTVGLAHRIRKLADDGIQIGLAVSLHQAVDSKRLALMPVNKKYPIPELLDACRYYIEKTNRRISFEWALITGETDTEESARELGSLLKGMLCHINVIPLNPTKGYDGKPTNKIGVDKFIKILGDEYGITCTPRTRRGIDIDAGCGQLTTDLINKRNKKNIETQFDIEEKFRLTSIAFEEALNEKEKIL